ncbi:hypothetical protein Tco_1111854 [Tanacetum coccineum]|uniref:Uncharacterized protein n=1 Tax=Tanacetum coccineum TaxID=301880 RepID=A0ABQ5IN95_9ASTR
MPHDSPLLGGNTPGSVEGSMSLNELTDLCTTLLDKVTSLENDLKKTKQLYGKAITKLVKKVKFLEDKIQFNKERRKAKMVISDNEEELGIKDTFNQGRIEQTEFEDLVFTEVTPTKDTQGEVQCQDSSDAQLGVLNAAKILADASRKRVKIYTRRRKSTDSSRVSTAAGIFSTAEDIHDKDQLDKREDTDDIDWTTVAEHVQEKESDAIKTYQTLKKKPVSIAQARKNMMTYLKNMAGYKMHFFKGMSYDEIRPIFEVEYNKLQTLFKKDTEVEKTKTKRVVEETLLQESFKYPIINREVYTEESRLYWKIIRVGDHIEAYQTFEDMLKKLDREDLENLWTPVKERFNTTVSTSDKEKKLWVELKRLFELDEKDMLWKLQRYMHDPLIWKLYDTCGVHHVSSSRGYDIFMLVEKDYPLTKGLMGIMLVNKLQVEEDSEMARNLIMKIFTQANSPRSTSV